MQSGEAIRARLTMGARFHWTSLESPRTRVVILKANYFIPDLRAPSKLNARKSGIYVIRSVQLCLARKSFRSRRPRVSSSSWYPGNLFFAYVLGWLNCPRRWTLALSEDERIALLLVLRFYSPFLRNFRLVVTRCVDPTERLFLRIFGKNTTPKQSFVKLIQRSGCLYRFSFFLPNNIRGILGKFDDTIRKF